MRVVLSPNPYRDRGLKTALKAREVLRGCGIDTVLCLPFDLDQGTKMDLPKDQDYREMQGELKCADLLLCFGGDGTILHAAKDALAHDIPVLGVNMGSVGFMAELEHGELDQLTRLAEGRYTVEHRMMLTGTAFHQSRRMLADIALNDIVISRNGRLRVVDFNVYVDGAFLSSYTADGIIISTPTGSTGYNLSVGGPIVAPEASLILLTAIAPHTLNSRPIVLPDFVEITIGTNHGTDIDGAEATFDGDTSVKLSSGDRIVITRSMREALMIKTKNTSFLEILREKMSREQQKGDTT